MSMTPNQSKEANKPLLEEDGTNQILGKIQSLAQYYGSIQFARTDPEARKATVLYNYTPLKQVQVAYPTAREMLDEDPFLQDLEQKMINSLSEESGTPDSISTSSEPGRSACESQDSRTTLSTKRLLEGDDANSDSMKRYRIDSRPDGRIIR
jgi:hypothetical protein